MASVWDAAKTLLAMAGGEDAALTASRELAAACARSGRFAEAALWRGVADSVIIEANPQPLIAPYLPPRPAGRTPESRWRQDQAMELPQHRSIVLRFRRDLRELWDRHGGTDEVSEPPNKEPE